MLKTQLLRFAPPALLLIVFFTLVYRKPIHIFPNKEIRINDYSDSAEGGNTQIHSFQISDTALSISYTLHKGYQFPYAGVSVEPETNYFPNLSAYDYIDLDLSTSTSRSVQFFLNVYEPGITKKDIPLSYRYILYECKQNTTQECNDCGLKIDQIKEYYNLSFKQYIK